VAELDDSLKSPNGGHVPGVTAAEKQLTGEIPKGKIVRVARAA
jgi:hypothetical protein